MSLAEALNALCAEVGIPFEEMLHTVESALGAAYVRAFNPPGQVTVKLDTTTGALDVRSRVVHADGSVTVDELPSENFKRMAAQTAKHAVLRHIHDLERDKVLRDVAEHRGELASGVVDRIEAGVVYVDLGRAEGVMPPEEQIPGETLHPGRPVLIVILDTQHNRKQAQVRVSRASRSFVHRLLEAEVPEIKAGTVQIRAIAREPGLRTKIAVSATEPGLDPVGACVGPKGVRHRAILSELANEHIDIDVLVRELAEDCAMAHALGAHARAHRVEPRLGCGHGDLGPQPRLAGDGANLHGAGLDLRHLGLQQTVDERARRAGN